MVYRGFTLTEILVTLAVSALLMWAVAPSMANILRHQASASVANRLIATIRYSRHAAINLRTPTTLCAGNRSGCFGSNQWHRGAIVFADTNANGMLDGSEQVLQQMAPLAPKGRIFWRSFRNRAYLHFRPSGLSIWQSGHFLYCPDDADPTYARQVILNSRGRSRLARDTDGDRIAEDASGIPLTCPQIS
jgi:type IV fimbrial biogenesis protein FimT